MTVVLLLHPKINCMTIPAVVPVNSFRTILPVIISANPQKFHTAKITGYTVFPELF